LAGGRHEHDPEPTLGAGRSALRVSGRQSPTFDSKRAPVCRQLWIVRGYTALTEAHGDEQSAELTSQFFSAVRGLVDEHGAGLVKTIGDAVMFAPTPPRRR
jgi:class 3 adenylate cyclase